MNINTIDYELENLSENDSQQAFDILSEGDANKL